MMSHPQRRTQPTGTSALANAAAAWQQGISSCAHAVRSGSVSATKIATEVMAEIARREPTLHAFTFVEPEQVLTRAEQIDALVARGDDPGSLAGVPVGVKDLFDVEGLPTSYGSAAFEPYRATNDATAVRGLREQGALLVGKTRTAELAWSTITPPTCNPVDPTRVAGGSSGGSAAAVGAGCVLGALGTDTGGSIRIPASLCGVVGIKPTYGLIGRTGVLPANWSLDTVGPLARSVADCRLLLAAMCQPDTSDPAAVSAERLAAVRASLAPKPPGLERVRLGVPRSAVFEILDPEISALFDHALADARRLGFEIIEVSIPEADWAPAVLMAIDLPEGAAIHTERLREHGELIQPEIRSLLIAAHLIPGAAVARGHSARRLIRDAVKACFREQRLDALLVPANPAVAVRQDDINLAYTRRDGTTELAIWSYARTCWFANLTGQPALTLPLPGTKLPVGVQLIGRPFDEGALLQIAELLERGFDPPPETERGADRQ
jgi:aspartyl-tRNA(Asn)/glutamyl-tRNA(Gln) amidotransferase subunit A